MLILSVYVLTLLFFLSLVGLTRQRQDQTSITSLLVIEKMLSAFFKFKLLLIKCVWHLIISFCKIAVEYRTSCMIGGSIVYLQARHVRRSPCMPPRRMYTHV